MRAPRLLSLLLVLTALLLAAGTGAFLFRNALAGGVIRWQLAAHGLDAQLRVAELGLGHIELREIAVGEQRIARLRADYTLSELRRGQVRRVEIEGLEMTLDLTGAGPPLGSVQDFVDGLGGDARQNVLLPTVQLNGARLTVLAPDELIQLDDEPDHNDLCKREQEFFLKAITENLDVNDQLDAALNSMRIVAAADESYKTGKMIEL